MYDDFLRRKFHGRGVITLQTSQHDPVGDESKLVEGLTTDFWTFSLCDWRKQFLIEDRNMVEASMVAVGTFHVCRLRPVKLRAFADFAEIAGERLDLQKSHKREEFPDTVLYWSARETPLVVSLEGKACFGDTRGPGFDAVSFIEDKSMKLDGMNDAIFFQYAIVSFPAFGLFPVHGLETSVRDHYHVVGPEILPLECFDLGVRVVMD